MLAFLLQRNNDTTIDAPTVGKAILESKGLFTGEWGFWLSIGALIGFIILFNILYLLALTYLSRKHYYFRCSYYFDAFISGNLNFLRLAASVDSSTLVLDEDKENEDAAATSSMSSSISINTILYMQKCDLIYTYQAVASSNVIHSGLLI
jgi:hypothetical protein